MNQRDCLDLNGLWRFSPDPHGDGEIIGFWRPEYEARLWREVMVPSCFEAGCPDIDFYEGVCWYRRTFRAPSDWAGRRTLLRFEAVNYRARVWLNGEWLGEHRDGFLPFEFDLRDKLRWDAENVLTVSVDNAHHEGDVPGMHVGWRGYGGILREVRLQSTAPFCIERVRVIATPEGQGGEAEFGVSVRNDQDSPANGLLDLTVYDPQGRDVATLRSPLIQLEPWAASTIRLDAVLPSAQTWFPGTPALYSARAALTASEGPVDEVETRFGFRRIEATPDGLLLNGQPIFLTGFNRHEDSPRTAMAADLGTARRDLEQMKEAGANFVRLCHYPHHPGELDLCDELGLLAFCEIPLYFWNDPADGLRANEIRAHSAARQLEAMVARDFNHPSVIFWSVSNETPEDEPAVAESNRALIRKARSLDPTRLCVHVSNHWIDAPNFDEDDVICVNHYPSIDWGRRGHGPEFDLKAAHESWRTELAALHSKYPSKPVLVTEFGYPSFAGTYGQAFGEDRHARVLETEFAGFNAPFVCGAAVWCWADHPWPAGRFFGGLSVSPFGVVSRRRRKLQPFWTARAMFRTRLGLETPPGSTGPQGTGVIMIRPHLRDVPQVAFPEGCGIRPMTVEDIGLWTDIQRDAEPYLTITDALFHEQFGDDLEAIRWRCFILTGPKGLGVGTISAWYDRDFRGEDYGRVHWISVRPSCQGRGLGKAALSDALNQLAQWHERAYLNTSTERVAAICLYLNVGFEPDLTPSNALAAWRELSARLKHPALEKALAAHPE